MIADAALEDPAPAPPRAHRRDDAGGYVVIAVTPARHERDVEPPGRRVMIEAAGQRRRHELEMPDRRSGFAAAVAAVDQPAGAAAMNGTVSK